MASMRKFKAKGNEKGPFELRIRKVPLLRHIIRKKELEYLTLTGHIEVKWCMMRLV